MTRASRIAVTVVGGAAIASSCAQVLGYEDEYSIRDGGTAGSSTSSIVTTTTSAAGGAAGASTDTGMGAGGCGVAPVCQPQTVEACGLCGARVCTDACTWGACMGEGVCTPGTTQLCPSGCGEQHCSSACTWCGCPLDSCSGCTGAPNGWLGCRGNGCAVCIELVNSYPCYFQNHPLCGANFTCEGSYFRCSTSCPAPSPLDACVCGTGAAPWNGCSQTACGVCEEAVKDYACYFDNHPSCLPAQGCNGTYNGCSDLCPAPTAADKGSL